MADEHFSRDTIERFFRLELSQDDNREFVRHLLRQCPQCTQILREIAQRQDFRFLFHALEETAFRSGPGCRDRVLRKVPHLAGPEEIRAGPAEGTG